MQYALDHDYAYIYLLNQDAWIFPDTIQILIDCHKRNPQYGILSPFQMEANMQHLDSNFNVHICSQCKDFIDDAYLNALQDVYSVPMAMAAHWLISKECLYKVGVFSPTFPHYGEDNNYANRILYHKFLMGIVPKAKAIHDRENRVKTKAQKAYLDYIGNLIIVSDIYNPYSFIFTRTIFRCMKTIFNYRNITCIKYSIKFLLQYNHLKYNKEVTKGLHAFLNE